MTPEIASLHGVIQELRMAGAEFLADQLERVLRESLGTGEKEAL